MYSCRHSLNACIPSVIITGYLAWQGWPISRHLFFFFAMPCCMQLQMAMGIWNMKSVVAILVTPFAGTTPFPSSALPFSTYYSLPLPLRLFQWGSAVSHAKLLAGNSLFLFLFLFLCVWVWQYFCFTRFYLHLLIVYNEYLCVADCAISRQKREDKQKKKQTDWEKKYCNMSWFFFFSF